MCAIVGLVNKGPVNQELYDALTVLQHRGQDAAGIVTCDEQKVHVRKGNGLVRDVFQTRHMLELTGRMGIGHVRYPTAGSSSSAEAQPFYVNAPYGISLAHNGNLVNADNLRQELFRTDLRHVNTGSDSEILLNVLAHELLRSGNLQLSADDIFQAVRQLHTRCRGGYAAIAMIVGNGLVAFRDPFGIRPICFGVRDGEYGEEYMVASESVALDALGFQLLRDLLPGEAIFVDISGNVHTEVCASDAVLSPCIFEYVYLARPDSIIDDVSVYKARLRMGEKLADTILDDWPDHDIDVVIPIPDTSRTACLPLAYRLDVKYREGFMKNRYIGRTFIMPGQTERKKSVRQKLNPVGLEFDGKNVLLVDDSIVRGTTSEQIIRMARDSGARKVYFASAAPPVRYQNVYGIDMPVASELVAHNRTEQGVADAIGADRMFYQTLDGLVESVQKGNPRIRGFDTSVFTGDYVSGDVSTDYLERIANLRNDAAKQAHLTNTPEVLELHNQR